MTVVRKCDRRFVSWWGGVMVMGRSIKGLEEVHHWTGSASHQGGVKDIKNECQLMEGCDGHGGDVRRCGKV